MFKLFIIKHSDGSYTYNIYAGNNRLLAKGVNTYQSEITARFAASRFAKGMSPLGYPISQQIRIVDYSESQE
jgi:uncharacterized protein YegP (UPF0339 family)